MRIFLSLLLFLSGPAFGQSSVWRIQKDGHTAYIGGTVHLLRQSDYPLPGEFLEAYKSSDTIVLETDLRKARSEEFQEKLLSMVSQKNGVTLKDEITPAAYRELAEYCQSNKLNLKALSGYKASIVSTTLAVVEIKKLGMDAEGVDSYFEAQANNDGKTIETLESPEEQIQFIVNMGKENKSELISSTIHDMKELKSSMLNIISSWRKGDSEKLAAFVNGDMKKRYNSIYQDIFVRRTDRWLPKIEKMLNTDAIEFILVGSGHVVGSDGLLAKLKSHGYTIEQL